ncbi:MAG: hypothetical protein ACXWG0_05885, partial [Chthoniobacterales bacterium]
AIAEAALQEAMQIEIGAARSSLLESSRELLPAYLLFGAENVRGLFVKQLAEYPADLRGLPPRNNSARKVEQSLILYLQRIAAKNDTFSRFGPSAWGRAENDVEGLTFVPDTDIARRELFLERWTAQAIAEVINTDPEILPELAPRMNPNGRIANQRFIFVEDGSSEELTSQDLEILLRCDGRTPVHSIGNFDSVRVLTGKKVLRCALEVPALDPHAFRTLIGDVEKWRPTAVREKWLSLLRPIENLPQKFGATSEIEERAQVLEEGRQRLNEIGASAKSSERSLYSAINVIGEECVRECDVQINEKLLNEVAVEAAPWIGLWRDSYAFVASRVAAGLRAVFGAANAEGDAMPLPAFLRACEAARLPLTGPGLIALAADAFQEVKNKFLDRLREFQDAPEHELSADECHVVSDTFDFPRFDEYTYPSADLQIAAESTAAIAAGDYQWILSELHPPVALLHHGFYWSCPDKTLLNESLAETTCGQPNFHFGFFAADFTSHTTVRLFDALPGLTSFIAPQRPGNPDWPIVRPADAEVYVDPDSRDVCVRKRGSHEYLGSFARAWLIPLGFHPFHFSRAPHMPRLRCGNVIVQRRSWTVAASEFPPGKFSGVSRELIVGVEQLRAAKSWPRHIYIRPTEQALRRSGAEGRDKDTKPVYVDLESYLSLEIFHRWLTKSGELEVTEMLPDPDHLCWQESDGRRTFELRTLIVPRA